VHAKIENIYKVMVDLKRGRDFDLELLTVTPTSTDKSALSMVHFNKTLT
jgi:hypothetical protein